MSSAQETKQLAIFSSGVWRIRDQVALTVGGNPRRWWWSARHIDAVVGWGHKPTANRARQYAAKHNLPYIALEDGFIRSKQPEATERPASLVMDTRGIYYDARQPSDFEFFVHAQMESHDEDGRANAAMNAIKQVRISKYNNSEINSLEGVGLSFAICDNSILIIDQTKGDASIEGAHANSTDFERMLLEALLESQARYVIIKAHPDVISGRKLGYLDRLSIEGISDRYPDVRSAVDCGRLKIVTESINPWVLVDACPVVYTVSSQLGFEAIWGGAKVHCFGSAFYSSWGLTIDRKHPIERRKPATLQSLFSALYFDYSKYFSRNRDKIVELEDVIREFSGYF